MNIFGLDIGYGNTKAVFGELSGEKHSFSLPSQVGKRGKDVESVLTQSRRAVEKVRLFGVSFLK